MKTTSNANKNKLVLEKLDSNTWPQTWPEFIFFFFFLCMVNKIGNPLKPSYRSFLNQSVWTDRKIQNSKSQLHWYVSGCMIFIPSTCSVFLALGLVNSQHALLSFSILDLSFSPHLYHHVGFSWRSSPEGVVHSAGCKHSLTHTDSLYVRERAAQTIGNRRKKKLISHSNECYLLTDNGMAGYSLLKAQSCTVACKHIRTCMNDLKHSKTIHNMNYAQRTDVFCLGLYNINIRRSWAQQE